MQQQIFKDHLLNKYFDENGYIVLPYSTAEEVTALEHSIFSLHPSDAFHAQQVNGLHKQDFHCTFLDTNQTYREDVFNLLKSFFNNASEKYMNDYEFVQANFFRKAPGKGYITPHQNLTITNEQLFTSVSFWTPTVDSTTENGSLVMIPGSHKRFNQYRTTNHHWNLQELFEGYLNPLFKHIEIKKGELLILDDSIIHGSDINKSSIDRCAFHAILKPKKAPLYYFDITPDDKFVNIFNVPPCFYQTYVPGNKVSNLKLIKTVPNLDTPLDQNQVNAILSAKRQNKDTVYDILKDRTLNDELNFSGYISLPFINDEEIRLLRELYQKWHPVEPKAFYRSCFNENETYKTEVEQEIFRILKPKIEAHLNPNFLLTGGMFIVKPTGDMQGIGVHQDWTFVDETKYWSLNLWIPLQDVSYTQGAIQFLKGSHKFLRTIRGAHTTDFYDNLYPDIEQYFDTINSKAGEAAIFFHNTVHSTTHNTMPHSRVCIGLSIIQKNAPIHFHLGLPDKKNALVYEVAPDFYSSIVTKINKYPIEEKLIGNIKLPDQRLTSEELKENIRAVR